MGNASATALSRNPVVVRRPPQITTLLVPNRVANKLVGAPSKVNIGSGLTQQHTSSFVGGVFILCVDFYGFEYFERFCSGKVYLMTFYRETVDNYSLVSLPF